VINLSGQIGCVSGAVIGLRILFFVIVVVKVMFND
jgi:tetrahydromethanopterin S-methyltransferase subunit G